MATYEVVLTFTVQGRDQDEIDDAAESAHRRAEDVIESYDFDVTEADYSVELTDEDDDCEEPEEWRDMPAPGTTRYTFSQTLWTSSKALIVRPCMALAVYIATAQGPVDVSAYTPDAYGSRGDGPEDVQPGEDDDMRCPDCGGFDSHCATCGED